MSTNIKPLGDRILIERPEAGQTQLASGLYVAQDPNQKDINKGTVIAVGPGKTADDGSVVAPTVKVGDQVVFSWGDKLELDGKKYELVSEANVLAIIES